jgi:hypothetical protein
LGFGNVAGTGGQKWALHKVIVIIHDIGNINSDIDSGSGSRGKLALFD